ncbi:MAG: class I SAM-dependent methyltransferase [bacterium]
MVKDILKYLEFIDSRAPDNKQQNLIIEGMPLRIYPGVWNPKKGKSSKMFIEILKDYSLRETNSALDLGTGSGILALILWKRGVQKIVAADIMDEALENAEYNFRQNKASKIEIRKSNLFSDIQERFDLIIFNAPATHPLRKEVLLGKHSLWSSEENILKRFLSEIKGHLTKNGRALLMYSKFVDFDPLSQQPLEKNPLSYSYLITNKGDLSESSIIEIKN